MTTTLLLINIYAGEERIPGLKENTWLFALLVSFLLLLGMVRAFSPSYFWELFRTVLDLNYVQLMEREGKLKWNIINILLDIIFAGSFSFFLYQLQSPDIALAFWECFLAVGAFVLLHLSFTALMGSVFYDWDSIRIFLYNIVLFNRVAGIVILPLVFATTYMPENLRPITLKILGLLVIFYWSFRILRALFQMKGKFHHGFFYNFMYLCTIEVSPLLIALKLISLTLINWINKD